MFCQKCGTENTDATKFCVKCGADVAVVPTQVDVAGPSTATSPSLGARSPASAPVAPGSRVLGTVLPWALTILSVAVLLVMMLVVMPARQKQRDAQRDWAIQVQGRLTADTDLLDALFRGQHNQNEIIGMILSDLRAWKAELAQKSDPYSRRTLQDLDQQLKAKNLAGFTSD